MIPYWYVFDTKIISFLVEERVNISCPKRAQGAFVIVNPRAFYGFSKRI